MMVTVKVGKLEFQFKSMAEWINRSPHIWIEHDLKADRALCVDSFGRICEMGKDFQRAKDDGAYPIRVYRKAIAANQQLRDKP